MDHKLLSTIELVEHLQKLALDEPDETRYKIARSAYVDVGNFIREKVKGVYEEFQFKPEYIQLELFEDY